MGLCLFLGLEDQLGALNFFDLRHFIAGVKN